MSLGSTVTSDRQLARLLQIGAVLEEVVEARAHRHYRSLDVGERDEAVARLLEEAAEESAAHRGRLERLLDDLDAEPVGYEEIERLVEEHYGRTRPEDFDGVLYDQLCNEETAYKFYDDLIGAIEGTDARFAVDRDHLLAVLREIREDEAAGVEDVTDLMETR
jgi:rubrerythrin